MSWESSLVLTKMKCCRLQELEDQYRKEREEASNLLEQQRLVGARMIAIDHKNDESVLGVM